MVDVTTDIVIERPVEDVATYAGDPSNAPEWYVNIDVVRWESEPVVAVGSRATFVARFLGRTLEYTYEIIDLVPNELLVMATAQGPFPMETTYRWNRDGPTSTAMTLNNRGRPKGFRTAFAPFMAAAMRRANRKDLRTLKAILER